MTPNLNEARYLPGFLYSLKQQTFKNFDLVIVDGGSQDASIAIISGFESALKIKLIVDTRRNIGYVRNVGARAATGEIMLQTNSDTYLPADLLTNIAQEYARDPRLISLSGRTVPLGEGGVLGQLAYIAFDIIRYLLTLAPFPLHKYRPGGSLISIKKKVFEEIGGFPELPINEDGALGKRIDVYLLENPLDRVKFCLNLTVGHHAKRFEMKGTFKTVLFYCYVVANMAPIFKPLFKHIERRSAETFVSRKDLK